MNFISYIYRNEKRLCLLRPPLVFEKNDKFKLRIQWDDKISRYRYHVSKENAPIEITAETYNKLLTRSQESP